VIRTSFNRQRQCLDEVLSKAEQKHYRPQSDAAIFTQQSSYQFPDALWQPPASVRRLALDRATLFEERVTDLPHCFSEKITPLLLGPEHDEVYQALTHLSNQLRQIDWGISSSFNVLSYDVIYVAVQTALV
jgi:hypothetical protein